MTFPVGLWTAINSLQGTLTNPMQAPRAYEQLTEDVSGFEPANGGVGADEISAAIGEFSALTAGRAWCRFGAYLSRPDAIAVMRGIIVA